LAHLTTKSTCSNATKWVHPLNVSLPESKRENSFLHYFLLGSTLLLTVLVQLFYSLYDVRSLPDHDLFFAGSFFSVYYHLLGDHSLFAMFAQIGRENPTYPFITFLLSCLAYIIPTNLTLFRLFTFVFYLLLILAGYRIGDRLANKKVGLLCAFVLATLPVFDNYSRKFDLQFHAAVMALWAYYYALTIFKTTWTSRHSLLLGLLIGAAVTTHPTAVVTLMPLLVFLFIFVLTEGKQSRWPWLKISLIIIAAALPILVFLNYFITPYLAKMSQADFLSGITELTAKSPKRLGDYLMRHHRFSLGPFYYRLAAPAFVLTVISLLINKPRRFHQAFLVLSIFWILGALVYAYPAQLLPSDFQFLYAPAAILLVVETHALFTHGSRRRWVNPLAAMIVLAIVLGGVWTKAQALSVLPADQYFSKQLDFRTEMRSLVVTKDFGRAIIDVWAKSDTPTHITVRQMEIVREEQTLKLVPNKEMYYIFRNLGIFANKRISLLTPRRQGLPRFRLCYYRGNEPLGEKDIAAILRQIQQLDPYYLTHEQYIFEKRMRRFTTPLGSFDYVFAIMQKTN